MPWNLSHLPSSLLGLLRDGPTRQAPRAPLAHIRQAMLDCMAALLDSALPRPAVWARVQQAVDVQSLWFLRCDVMHLLSHHCGETLAAAQLRQLTKLFGGHVPAAQFASSQRRRPVHA